MAQYLIYLRKSRADREAEARGDGDTLARHRTALLDLARRNNYAVAKIYEEVVSGETIAARPEMQRLLRDVESGDYAGVLVMWCERLARGNTRDQGIVAETFQYSGTKIITPSKIYDPEDEADQEYFEFGLFMSRRGV
jgi:DNA invertase Pin-like site-specific DNA recombinase